ncbi:Uncharacterized [Syntrophomonas zehnderi OL-4]|uniref:Uncharacterized n=1 Tax=Syntrophomonas zehnderi OL-4 TaxID=690567 RepID=A0A0E4GBN3_9FIRM|nr:hypothetical protein [Syntrophomonas zehnderi]CFX91711.1 Uncharacterized [Syntrophomonas zehnderi OL-4]
MRIVKRIISILVIAGVFIATGPNIPVLAAVGTTAASAAPVQYDFYINGERVSLWAYEIEDDVYFKLRDLAMILNDTEKHFGVTWYDDGKERNGYNLQVKLSPQLSYTPVGGELSKVSQGIKVIAHMSSCDFHIDDTRIPMRAFTINHTNYISLSDIAINMSFTATLDKERHTAVVDTKVYDTGLYSLLLPDGWKAEGLNFTRSGDAVGSLFMRTYDPDHTIAQFEDNHRVTLSSDTLDGFDYPAAKALIRATQPAAANDDSHVDELHIYIMLADLRCAFDFSFDSAKVDAQTAMGIVKSFVPKETAIKYYKIASQWAKAVKERNGRAQYELLSAELQSEYYDYYEAVGWVTGVSSPWKESYVIHISDNRVVVFYEGRTSEGFAGYSMDILSFSEENGQLRISGR